MNIKDVIEKIKNLMPIGNKNIESNIDKQYRIQCKKNGRLKDFEDYLKYKTNATNDIIRFQGYIDKGIEDPKRWKYSIEKKKKELDFIRPNNENDIKERNYWLSNFYEEFIRVIPENTDLRFHGTSIFFTKDILESGGIFSSVDINDGYMTSNDLSGEISATSINSLNRTIQFFSDILAYKFGLPCGCIFVLRPRTERDKELKSMDAMESVNFKNNPEQLYGIFTSTENIENVKKWLTAAGLNSDLAYTFEGFLNKIKEEKAKDSSFRQSLIVDENDKLKTIKDDIHKKDESINMDIEKAD